MRQKFLLTTLVLTFTSAVAHAQISEIYVTSSNLRATNVPSGTAGSPPATQYDTFWASGIGGGVTVNFIPLPVVSLGIDLRGSTKSGTTGADTALIGLKLGVHPPLLHIKPYVVGSAGYVATRTPAAVTGNTITNKYLGWELAGGVDYPLVHFVDFRVIEIGGGGVVDAGSGNAPSLFHINTGLVFHF